jgi:hypothetical protein
VAKLRYLKRIGVLGSIFLLLALVPLTGVPA